ncbi:MAG: isoleucine--tRNA ligase [Bacteroidota bacterium]|nr:isoleucine--tRNA ligase [Bacteroidota bacterium]
MAFKEYQELSLTKLSEEILAFWEEKEIFKKSITSREGSTPYIFFEGPPSANGSPGIHHVMARTIKDIFCRYKTQKGFKVERKAGWDTHGLPVELGVEKELGLSKKDIGNSISIEEYNAACKKAVMKYTDEWEELTNKIGFWIDMTDPYTTYDSKYIESVWWLVKKIYKKGLLYKGYNIQPYSPKAGTGISSHELNQPGTYKDVSDTSITAQFKTTTESLPKKFRSRTPLYMLAWTTTPWTLPSNTALGVGAKIKYVIVETFNEYTLIPIRVILAKNLVEKYFNQKYTPMANHSELVSPNDNGKIPYYIEQEIIGENLEGIKYEQIWAEAPLPLQNPENAFRVILGDFVTTEEGTGIVHIAPTFGADDSKAAKEATPEVPPLLIYDEDKNKVPLVDLEGKFRKELVGLGGKYVKNEYYDDIPPEKSVDIEIAIELKKANKAFKVEKHVHSYPNCWRTDKPILYYPLDSWFIKVSKIRNSISDSNKGINWKPKSTGEGRFGNWLSNANDWNLSRSRFWGIPLPIWQTKDSKEIKVIGSIEELIKEIKKSISLGIMKSNPFKNFKVGDMSNKNYRKIDLHKDKLDEVILSSENNLPMYKEKDLLDVWFDSGAMPYAQWHYPFENKEKIDERIAFPADYIAEGIDQTRGWFYTLHIIANIVFNSVAYKNVISNGLVLDKDGQKMSKRLGNAIDPFKTIEKYGADATRWYMISNSNPWDNLKFELDGVLEVQRKFFGTLYNTYSFFSLYANIDKFYYKEPDILIKNRPELDRWIISELNTLVKDVDQLYENYEPTRAARAISFFVQEKLSNWYVRLSRRRFWKGDYEKDKISGFQTLHDLLLTIAKLSAPIAPFYSDILYKDLVSNTKREPFESVHLSKFPMSNSNYIDSVLESRINKARIITSLALSLRKKEQIKVRQPLNKLMVTARNIEEKKEINLIKDQLCSEINVKDIHIIDDTSALLIKEIRPNYKHLGPKYGKGLKPIEEKINSFDLNQIKEIEANGSIPVLINKKNVILDINDVEIVSKDIDGYVVASTGGITVALDVKLSSNLITEGLARELVNRIQKLRKVSGFKVTDKIEIIFSKNEMIEDVLSSNEEYIRTETLSKKITFDKSLKSGNKVVLENIEIYITIHKI